MAENFDLIFGQNASQQYAWNDTDYQNGWETIGNIPPTAAQFDALQRRSDTKMKELNDELTPLVNADTADSRQPSTDYNVDDIKYSPLLPTGWYLLCTTAGTTSASDLVITSPTVGDTVNDGTVVWTIGKSANTADLSGYAPLASPTFTGTPKAPTPTSTDNSTRIATTAFVKANIPSMSGYANTSLSNLSDSGKKFFFPSSTYIDISSYVNTSTSGTTTYTAPDNGYVTLFVTRSSSTGANVSCDVKNNTSNIESKFSQQLVTGTLGGWVPCRKGDIIWLMSVGSSTKKANFVYIGG